MDIDVSFTIPYALLVGYFVIGAIAASGLLVYGHYTVTPRRKLRNYFSPHKLLEILLAILIWPVSVGAFVSRKWQKRARRKHQNKKAVA